MESNSAESERSPEITGFVVYVKNLHGSTFTVPVEENETVKGLKLRLQNIEGSHPDHMRIIFAGNQLEDSRYLRDCGIQNGSTVHLVERLRGGAQPMNEGDMGDKNSRNHSREELADFNTVNCTVL